MKKKLLLAGSNSIHTYNFIHLIEEHFDEILLLTNESPKGYAGKLKVLNFSLKNPLSAFLTIKKIQRIVAAYQPSVIHIHQANSAAWLILRATKHYPVKKVLTAWGSDILVNPLKGILYRKMAEQILTLADYFTADAVFLAERMRSLARKNIEVAVINFGIDPVCKDEASLNNLMLKKENIIYSNRLHKKLYRIDSIIRSFSDFVRTHSSQQWQLVIAGSGSETTALKKLTIERGISSQVIFTGWINQEQNFNWYSKAKIFVSYPESDATSVSLLEAMSAGCIPLLSDLPANREWISNGLNGILTKDLSANDYEKCLQLMNGDTPRQNFSTILNKATKDKSRNLFLKVYNSALTAS